jgi:hypothetical protein
MAALQLQRDGAAVVEATRAAEVTALSSDSEEEDASAQQRRQRAARRVARRFVGLDERRLVRLCSLPCEKIASHKVGGTSFWRRTAAAPHSSPEQLCVLAWPDG